MVTFVKLMKCIVNGTRPRLKAVYSLRQNFLKEFSVGDKRLGGKLCICLSCKCRKFLVLVWLFSVSIL